MNKFWPVIFLSYLFTSVVSAQDTLYFEQRLEQMEQRLKITEQRARDAENQIRDLKLASKKTNATNTPDSVNSISLSDRSNINFYGDVEFNIDGASRSGSLISVKTSTNKNWAPGNRERWDMNGRILLGFDGLQHGRDGKYAGFSVQPLADINGRMNLDDAAFFFGQQDDWKIKIGRFEAYDMFPLNQDTFVEYSGNTANDLYSDGYGYIYMMKEGRGRSNKGGNFLLSKSLNKWYFEFNTLIEDGSTLFVSSNYHGNTLDNRKNVVYARPVIAWQSGEWTVAAAVESNLINNAYGYQDNRGGWIDQSKRTGYGMTMSRNTLRTDSENGTIVNLSAAYLDAEDEKDFSAGINALWQRIEFGYIYAHNNIDKFNMAGIVSNCDNECAILVPGKYDIHTLYSSWHLPDILGISDFNIYLGAYTSWLESPSLNKGDAGERYGARMRFKYFF